MYVDKTERMQKERIDEHLRETIMRHFEDHKENIYKSSSYKEIIKKVEYIDILLKNSG